MSSNSDNAMARFLFAILKQKNLKDIDWNEVARDPVLTAEISNGHAARMRYARFRDAMIGLESTKRNKTAPQKSRVGKSKKDTKPKKLDGTRLETAAAAASPPSAKVKEEAPHSLFDSRLTPGLTPGSIASTSPIIATAHIMQQRLLTPCSDNDVFGSPSALAASPPADLVHHSQIPYDFHTSSCASHDDSAWQQGVPFSAFSAAYHYDDFGTGPGDHQSLHSQHTQLGLAGHGLGPVKNEDWDPYH